jgi:hypothetical protein
MCLKCEQWLALKHLLMQFFRINAIKIRCILGICLISSIYLKLYLFNGRIKQYKAVGHDKYLCYYAVLIKKIIISKFSELDLR